MGDYQALGDDICHSGEYLWSEGDPSTNDKYLSWKYLSTYVGTTSTTNKQQVQQVQYNVVKESWDFHGSVRVNHGPAAPGLYPGIPRHIIRIGVMFGTSVPKRQHRRIGHLSSTSLRGGGIKAN
jgi:hypothetical protein